jgi:hypothetical protein
MATAMATMNRQTNAFSDWLMTGHNVRDTVGTGRVAAVSTGTVISETAGVRPAMVAVSEGAVRLEIV